MSRFGVLTVWRLVACFALLWVAAGCADPCLDKARYSNCDIRQASCQAALTEAAQCLHGRTFEVVPPIRVITPEAYRAELTASVEAPRPIDRQFEAGLRLLGLHTGASTLIDSQVDLRATEIVAYYASRDHRVTIIDRGTGMNLESDTSTLIHELVHGLQNEEHDLTSLEPDTTDQALAVRSVIEGEAVFRQVQFSVRQRGYEDREIDWQRGFDGQRLDIETRVLRSSARHASATLLYPYAYGMQEVTTLLVAGRKADEARLWDPASWGMKGYMTGPRFPLPVQNAETVLCTNMRPPPDFTLAYTDVMGPLVVQAAVLDDASLRLPETIGVAYRADRFDLFSAGDRTAVVWWIRCDSSSSASAIAGAISRRIGRPVVTDRETVVVYGSDVVGGLPDWHPESCL